MTFPPAWLKSSSPPLTELLLTLGQEPDLGTRRFQIRNFLMEDDERRHRTDGYVADAKDRVIASDPDTAFQQLMSHHEQYLHERLRSGVRTEVFSSQGATCPDTFSGYFDDGDELVRDVAWLGRLERLAPISINSGESRQVVRSILDRWARAQREGIADPDAEVDANQLLLSWQQRLDNRPVAAFVWDDVADVLAWSRPGWEDELRDRLGLEHLDPTALSPSAGVDVAVFRYPVRLVPTDDAARPLLRRPTVFDDTPRDAFCTPPPVGAGFCVNLRIDERLCREVMHPAVTFKAEHLWGLGTIRAGVSVPLDELRGFHLLKLAYRCQADFCDRFEQTDGDLL
ncbi:hypothetical protein MCAG_04043 [Micromonospora sp. ATCC 39149]|uniref:Uncharacterized protein n=1 Tax=Micromonospora carbonacea TaxID=47853 RepID=A0A7D6CCD5_9ACTN|nr:hypothetical protein [Micromonospora sp. ATCC 39149]EEP73716.1 hypothetical protein MCAG_04043 [Micromonospora sp. ATCC 39149]QLJ99625.1 hypothetical protein HZU44_05790 [Micromonospora carbonacea]